MLSWSEIRRSQQRLYPGYTKAHTARRHFPVRVKRTDMNDVDYGEAQRQAKVFNERLLINWHADKPTVRLRWQAWVLIAAFWLVVAVVYLVVRGL